MEEYHTMPNLYRKTLYPRTLTDIGSTCFLTLTIPIMYWFELWIVLPSVYTPGTIIYYFHRCMGTFILHNVLTNMMAVILYDTSILGTKLLAPSKSIDSVKEMGWKFCSACEILTPPRSWHCNICKICILKRDHHCTFTGCCVGFKNHRYFIMLIMYLFIATTYASVYNNYFIWYLNGIDYRGLITLIKLLFPLAMFVYDASTLQIHLIIYSIGMIGMLFTGFLLFYHARIIYYGSVTHERNKRQYDLGLKKNLEIVFGKRWYLTWISPFIRSELPHNGIDWKSVSKHTAKNK